MNLEKPQHIVNETYEDYRGRNFLENYIKNLNSLAIIIFIVVCGIGGSLFMNSKLPEGIKAMLLWIVIIIAICLIYKLYKRFSIPKRRYSRTELSKYNY